MDTFEIWLNNPIVSTGLAALLWEYGLSRWQSRHFSKKKVWLLFVVAIGVRCALRGIN